MHSFMTRLLLFGYNTVMTIFKAQLRAGALWYGQAGGKLAVLGSVAMFEDKWLDAEDNAQIMDWLFRWLKPVWPLSQFRG